ncbi:MAG TPA: DUF6599 family protein [Bryobacteraceae bacterium]|nr:DUF6599 family protein [Bryobacteraceae bacterium]
MKFIAGLLLAAAGLANAAAPSCDLVPVWSQHGATRSYVADNLFEYMDGNAEGYLLYGFVNMQGVSCEKAGITLLIDVSEFADADSAFGMYCANRDLRQPETKLGMGGQIVPRRAIFAKGKFYVEIAVNQEGDHTAALQQWTAALASHIDGSSDPPAALQWFPPGQQSLRLVPESVLGIRLLQRGYVGEYASGKAFVVTEESPAAAAAVMERLRARFGTASPAKVADDAFQATDPYLGRLCIFRKSRMVGGYGNVAEGQDAAALAAALAARLP